jgi:hypothetical protein
MIYLRCVPIQLIATSRESGRHQCNNELTDVGLHPTFAARLVSRRPDQFRSSKDSS